MIGDAAGEERVRFERKKKNRESDGRRGLGFRWLLLDGGTQQPNKSRPKLCDILLGDGAQGDDDRGGCCCIVWAIELLDKNI